MNRVMTAALAGLVATATLASTLGTASAGGGYWQGGYGQGGNWQGGGWKGNYQQNGYWKGGPGYGPKPWKNYPPGPPPGPPPHQGNGNGNWGAAVAGGAILGLTLGAIIANQPPPPPRYAYVPPPPPPPVYGYYPAEPVYEQPAYPSLNQAHVDWCAANYPNYQPATDTYLAGNGVYYRCVGPY